MSTTNFEKSFGTHTSKVDSPTIADYDYILEVDGSKEEQDDTAINVPKGARDKVDSPTIADHDHILVVDESEKPDQEYYGKDNSFIVLDDLRRNSQSELASSPIRLPAGTIELAPVIRFASDPREPLLSRPVSETKKTQWEKVKDNLVEYGIPNTVWGIIDRNGKRASGSPARIMAASAVAAAPVLASYIAAVEVLGKIHKNYISNGGNIRAAITQGFDKEFIISTAIKAAKVYAHTLVFTSAFSYLDNHLNSKISGSIEKALISAITEATTAIPIEALDQYYQKKDDKSGKSYQKAMSKIVPEVIKIFSTALVLGLATEFGICNSKGIDSNSKSVKDQILKIADAAIGGISAFGAGFMSDNLSSMGLFSKKSCARLKRSSTLTEEQDLEITQERDLESATVTEVTEEQDLERAESSVSYQTLSRSDSR